MPDTLGVGLSLALVRPEMRRQELEGDNPFELEIMGLVHDPHTAAAQLLQDLVV